MVTDTIDAEAFQERLPDGWVIDDADDHDLMADDRHTESKLLHRVTVEVEHASSDHYHNRYYASYWAAHPLPNVGPSEEIEEFDSLDEAVDQAISWAHGE